MLGFAIIHATMSDGILGGIAGKNGDAFVLARALAAPRQSHADRLRPGLVAHRSRLTLNVGLRWGREKIADDTGQVVQTIDNEWQPRIGFVYLPGRHRYAAHLRVGSTLLPGAVDFAACDGETWARRVQRTASYDHDPRLDPTGRRLLRRWVRHYPETPGLRGNYFDEYSLGYELQLGERHRGGIRALYRTLGDAVEDANGQGRRDIRSGGIRAAGTCRTIPNRRRIYEALELTVQGRPTDRSGYFASYVYSENRGNYPGLFNTDFYWPAPNAGGSFDFPFMMDEGLLPNDRPHVFKASGFYVFPFGLNVGGVDSLAERDAAQRVRRQRRWAPYYIFLQPRGTAGRTPSIFDMSLRMDYTFTGGIARTLEAATDPGRVSPLQQRDAGRLRPDPLLRMDENGNQINPNPTYGR